MPESGDISRQPTVAFHGTPHRDRVLSEGLRADLADGAPCVWMARRLEDAAAFGAVVQIDLSQLDGEWPGGEWQAHYAHDIPPEALAPVLSDGQRGGFPSDALVEAYYAKGPPR